MLGMYSLGVDRQLEERSLTSDSDTWHADYLSVCVFSSVSFSY